MYGRKNVPAKNVPAVCHDGVRRLNVRRFEQKSRRHSVQRFRFSASRLDHYLPTADQRHP
jgi:hypothetical protein